MGEELDQQEIDLVAVGVHPGVAVEMVLQQSLQGFFAGQACSLKKLAQLMDLNLLVHFEQPLAGLFDRLLRRIFQTEFQVGARRGQFDDELAPQRAVQRMEQARLAPLRGQVLRFRFQSHGFTIQLETSWVKRAATAVRPLVYCSATTEASAFSVPSEFSRRSRSANSSGKSGREQHFTGRTELNHRAFGTDVSFPHHSRQAHRNAYRTCFRKELRQFGGAAFLPDARSARGLCGHSEYLGFPGSTRPGSPGCRLAWQGHPDRIGG